MSKEIEEISIGKDVEPITETQPPLVIDLPEGQKMVVGKLDPDTVIEVATGVALAVLIQEQIA